ncbi:uncharacterized protein LOC124433902 isoform X1 [Xenia sp. Carnegie-2017]|uniref:uncharacterized protein LOC124433902 isoform X1 n=1 Tax=Xenia sp. Carnegie-2017 TaxID=2897299 RepID=UPI001F04C91A|nr:uncharacterized protein LOC124433902 isoform X1 [Xenia sp. Carnegie-2017]
MPRKSVDSLQLHEILEIVRILNIKYDDETASLSSLKSILKERIRDQTSRSGIYANGISGAEVVEKAKSRDNRNRAALLHYNEKINECLHRLGDVDFPILNDLLNIKVDVRQYINDIQKSLEKKKYYLLIAGETSAGKSTILNLILGEDAVPHHTLHSTSTICEVKFGKDKEMIVHYKYENVQKRRRAPKVVSLERNEESEQSYAERIGSYVNPENTRETREIERVEIFWPHDLLKQGIVIVDSPGLGESEKMDEILMNYLPNAFAYIYILDVARAGGVQRESTMKMKKMAEKHETSNAGRHCINLLAECTLFVANKWDQVEKKEQDSVRKHLEKQLAECWEVANTKKHILTISAKNAIKVQECGGISPEFQRLLDSIRQLILRAIDIRLYDNWQKLDTILSQIFKLANFFKVQANLAQGNNRNRIDSLECRIKNIQSQNEDESEKIRTELQSKTKPFSDKIKEYIKTSEFEEKFYSWNTDDVDHMLEHKWKLTKGNIDKSIAEKFLQLINEWEMKERIHEKIHWETIDHYLKRLYFLKEELDSLGNDGNSLKWQVENLTQRSQQSFLAKILVGAMLPIWLPVAAAGVLISAPVLGTVVFAKEVNSHKALHKFEENPYQYLRHRSKTFLEEKKAQPILEEAQALINKTDEIVSIYSSLVLHVVEGDKKMVKRLSDDSRSNLEMEHHYAPIQEKSEELRDKITPLGLKLFPSTIDKRDLAWEPNLRSHVGEGEFARIYRGKRKIVKRSESPIPLLENIALKVFKNPFDQMNGRFYLNEQLDVRHLKHDNVLQLIGVMKQDDPQKYIFIMPLCKKSLRRVIFDYPKNVPAQSHDTNFATSNYKKWAKEIANGLNYVHERGLVHRHLKLENVLIKDNDVAAISDVGIVGEFKETEKSIIYHAPEVLENLHHMTKAADIYSFGIMLWEMWYGVVAFEELMPIVKEEFKSKVIKGHRPKNDENKIIIPMIQHLMMYCWLHEHDQRPTSKMCFQMLEN